MDRRDVLKGLALSAGLAGLPAAAAEGDSTKESAAAASSLAWRELISLLAEAERDYLSYAYGIDNPADQVEGRLFLAQALQASLEFFAQGDAERPSWTRFVTPHKKLLGDNPDAIYYSAPVNPNRRYRISGNVTGAVYTSFTVEAGTSEGALSKRLLATLNDTQFDVRADGSYEITAGGPEQTRNWLALDPEAGSITTRHYFEWPRSAAADPLLHIPLEIEPLDSPGAATLPSDAVVAANLRRTARFFRALTLDRKPPAQHPAVNQISRPDRHATNKNTGFAALDNVYASGNYELGPEQALIIRGRFPRARFSNVVLWNRYMQTFDYENGRVSLNRRQTKIDEDGSFRIVLAHRDPGIPNWLQTQGRPRGTIFWRFLLPEEDIEPLRTEVVRFADIIRA